MPTSPSKNKKLKIRSSNTTKHDTAKSAHAAESERGISSWLSWQAPDRIWEPKSRMWYLWSALVVLLVILFAVLSQYPSYPMLVIAMLMFLGLWFIQGNIAPRIVEHRLTNKGIYSREVLYHWVDLSGFWMARKNDHLVLYIDFIPQLNLPRQMFLVPAEIGQEVFDLIVTRVKYSNEREAQYNFISKLIYGEYLPISAFIADLD